MISHLTYTERQDIEIQNTKQNTKQKHREIQFSSSQNIKWMNGHCIENESGGLDFA